NPAAVRVGARHQDDEREPPARIVRCARPGRGQGRHATVVMTDVDYSAAGVPVREDLRAAHRFLLDHVASPGSWWTAAERIAIAEEARAAERCSLCTARKQELSPNAVQGRHDRRSELPDPAIEVIHRVRTDPGRLSRAWFDGIIADGLDEGRYVELVGVVAMMSGVDAFARALGIDPRPLPEPKVGSPSRYRPV